jgi:hypothetical protein
MVRLDFDFFLGGGGCPRAPLIWPTVGPSRTMPTVYYGYGTFISWSLKKIAFPDFEKNSHQVETFSFFGKPHLIEKGHSLQGTFSIPMYFTRCKKPRPSEKSTFEHFPDLGSS